MAESPATREQLEAWAADPASVREFSPLSARKCLLVGTSAVTPASSTWLASLPCPVIGVGGSNPACDVCVEDLAAAAPLTENIDRNPVAATLFVQLLRAAEGMPLEAALQAESLAYSTLQAGAEFRTWLASYKPEAPPAADAGDAVLIEREGEVLQLELNRPGNRNAMTVEVRDALVEALQLVLADDSFRSVQMRGRGKCFSTGGDLREFGTAPDPASAHIVRSLALPGRLLARCAQKVSVQVHGACVGSGIEFPAFAGRITASADAWFQLPELSFGLIPGAGGTVSIARRIGRQRTAWLALSGKRIKAGQALEWGLVDALETAV